MNDRRDSNVNNRGELGKKVTFVLRSLLYVESNRISEISVHFCVQQRFL